MRMKSPKNWKDWQHFAANAPEKDVRALLLKLVLKNAGKTGTIHGLETIRKIERQSYKRLFQRFMAVCQENETLGGKQGKKAMAHYTWNEDETKVSK